MHRFGPLPIEEVKRRLQTVIEQEKVQLTPDGLNALLKLSRGDMRRALNVLQVCLARLVVGWIQHSLIILSRSYCRRVIRPTMWLMKRQFTIVQVILTRQTLKTLSTVWWTKNFRLASIVGVKKNYDLLEGESRSWSDSSCSPFNVTRHHESQNQQRFSITRYHCRNFRPHLYYCISSCNKSVHSGSARSSWTSLINWW